MFSVIRDIHINYAINEINTKYEFLDTLLKRKDQYKTISEIEEFMKHAHILLNINKKSLIPLGLQYNYNTKLISQLNYIENKINRKQLANLEYMIISDTGLRHEAKSELELEIAQCEEKERLLRLMCLLSLTENGIDEKKYYSLTNSFIYAFGLEETLRIMNLKKVGLLKIKPKSISSFLGISKDHWKDIKAEFNLMPERVGVDRKSVV